MITGQKLTICLSQKAIRLKYWHSNQLSRPCRTYSQSTPTALRRAKTFLCSALTSSKPLQRFVRRKSYAELCNRLLIVCCNAAALEEDLANADVATPMLKLVSLTTNADTAAASLAVVFEFVKRGKYLHFVKPNWVFFFKLILPCS